MDKLFLFCYTIPKEVRRMRYIFPDYYADFRCIGGACRHNCCIGWEIDIDKDTAAYYRTVQGEMGARLRENISRDGEPHFVLGADERCPFLNADNLCDIIIHLGEEHLCGICNDHPRFKNELPDRVEIGVGMACEEAARLILGKVPPTVLVGGEKSKDEIIALRDRVIALLQNRKKSIPNRVCGMLSLCGAALPDYTLGEWAEIFLDLERLDEKWTELLEDLRDGWKKIDFDGFAEHMSARQTEYEQFLVYLIYRHFANAPDFDEAAARAAFAALGCTLLHALGALTWTKSGKFTFADQVELCRMFSSEIEYSDENVYALLDLLGEMY